MRHAPVLLTEVIESLQLKPNYLSIDCTIGDAGHAEAILKQTSPNGKLLGIDADPESLLRSKQNLYKFGERVTFVRSSFANLKNLAEQNEFNKPNAILMDLGWSSPQFEERGRGFSFKNNETLDMRYSAATDNKITAAEVLNNYTEKELELVFRQLGEEDLSKEIASAAVKTRKTKSITKTTELVELVLQVYRKKLNTDKEIPWVGGLHPATKVFQALRIEVNHELDVLEQALPQAVGILAPQGRFAVIAFHSLEDRIIKQYFKSVEGKRINLVSKKPIVASGEEIRLNPRARSAKLRVIEKV
jgi:16S rRNA (cytosine1402-N4)-methyltransferase